MTLTGVIKPVLGTGFVHGWALFDAARGDGDEGRSLAREGGDEPVRLPVALE